MLGTEGQNNQAFMATTGMGQRTRSLSLPSILQASQGIHGISVQTMSGFPRAHCRSSEEAVSNISFFLLKEELISPSMDGDVNPGPGI